MRSHFQLIDQWLAIVNHAKNYQELPIAGFVTFYSGNLSENEILRKGAFSRGIVTVIVSLKAKKGLKAPL